jgi:serine/threonine protein kinase
MSQPLDDDRTVAAEAQHRGAGSAHSENALPVGTRLHEFEIIDLVGEGGFGIVYLARDCVLERKVALKEYLPSALASRGPGMTVAPTSSGSSETFQIGLRSFINEGRMLAQFDHPALVKVYRFWEANGTAYMVMPYYQGITLKEALQSAETPPDEFRLKQLLAQLLDALEVLHRANALHRDIAPDNILILPGGNPVLLDFGAARRVITDRTQNFTAILKPGYAPLEQYAESPSMKQGPWTDLYALAGVVYFAITGEKPAPAVARTIADPLVPFHQAGSGRYSPEFLRALDRALAVKPDDRPQSVGEFRSLLELDRVQSTVTRKTQPPERPAAGGRGLRPGLVAGVAVALVAAIGAAAVLKWGKATPPAAIATSAPAPAPQSKPPPEVIDTPSAAVPAAPPVSSDVQPPEQKTKEGVASSVVPKPPKQAPKVDARPAAAAESQQPPENRLASLVAAFLQDGEKCFRAKQYDCAIAKADAALQVEPGSAPARQLKTAAAEEQQRAIKQIKIE